MNTIRPSLTYRYVAMAMIVASFCVSIVFSKMVWGYYFFRPNVPNEINNITSVSAVIPVTTVNMPNNQRSMIVEDGYSMTRHIDFSKKYPYDTPAGRLLFALQDKNLLPSQHTTDASKLPELFTLVRDTGILAKPAEGYSEADMLNGVVIDAMNKSGQRLVFLGLRGQQVSNDHYPYYELVFSGTPGSTALSYVRGQRFFYDIAGIEGLEWYIVWPFCALIGIIGGFVIVTIKMLIVRFKQARLPILSPQN